MKKKPMEWLWEKNINSLIKACFTLGVRADVQPKPSNPIGAKVEISPKGFALGLKAEIE